MKQLFYPIEQWWSLEMSYDHQWLSTQEKKDLYSVYTLRGRSNHNKWALLWIFPNTYERKLKEVVKIMWTDFNYRIRRLTVFVLGNISKEEIKQNLFQQWNSEKRQIW